MDLFAMYLRKSRADMELEELGQGETLTRHYNTLMQLAERKGILPEQIVIFREVVSGESIAARPEMQKLLNDVYMKRFKSVLCMEVERLARGNTKDQGEVADAFTYSGTHILTPVKEYDPCNEFDQEYFEFGLFMSRREYKVIKRRMEAGRMQSFREGNYVGSIRPYGYDIKRISKKERILVEVPEESRIVRMIFNWWTEDRYNIGAIMRNLNAMQIPTMTGKPEWNRGTIIDILKNHHYIGLVRWNRRKTSREYEDGAIGKKKRRNTFDSMELAKGKHIPLISEEQFNKAQTLFNGSVPLKAMTTLTNPLSGILVCAKCGKAIRYNSYECRKGTAPRFIHVESQCKVKSCKASELLYALTEALKQIVEDYEVKTSDESVKAELKQHQELIEALEAELKKQQNRKNRLFDSWEADDGTYTKEEFLTRKRLYDDAISGLKEKLKQANQAAPVRIDYHEKITTVKALIESINDPSIEAEAKNKFLKEFIDEIKYDYAEGQILLDVYLK